MILLKIATLQLKSEKTLGKKKSQAMNTRAHFSYNKKFKNIHAFSYVNLKRFTYDFAKLKNSPLNLRNLTIRNKMVYVRFGIVYLPKI